MPFLHESELFAHYTLHSGFYKIFSSGVYWSYLDYTTLRDQYRIGDYNTLQQAEKVCKSRGDCKGITQIDQNKFRLYRDDKPIYSSTRRTFFRGGPALNKFSYETSFGGYGWSVVGPARLDGSADGREYTDRKTAMKVSLD